jgi:hypothetical protein
LPLGLARRLDIGVHHRSHHLQPGPDGHREQPSCTSPASSAIATVTVSGNTGVVAVAAFFW